MKTVMEAPLKVGETLVAVLASHDVRVTSSIGLLAFSGGKVPLAIILRQPDGSVAYHPDGRKMDLPNLRKLCRDTPDTMKALSDLDL